MKSPAQAVTNLETQFSEYIKGKRKKFDLQKLQIHDDLRELTGTDLQKSVWRSLRSIPYGKTITYSELSKRVGKPKAVRAVASAVANNPLCIIIPCHRVVPKTKAKSATKTKARLDIGNYALGQDMKRILLELEGAIS
ncbi:MAG: methylated-DNA--[protein]-cysteine S-methyltransferase [Candidatus Pacebacteria bacterium]|nr:methylated-DNA--[protein]-cysteine S-methyltransferase [Candidatus Paceibacterota bacterium]